MREIEVERSAQILKQADPGHPVRSSSNHNGRPPSVTDMGVAIAIISSFVTFVAIATAMAHR